jgi:hypothetical protein
MLPVMKARAHHPGHDYIGWALAIGHGHGSEGWTWYKQGHYNTTSEPIVEATPPRQANSTVNEN